jgi:hypothetical protein
MKSIVIMIFFCVGVMYSGEYDVCDVTLGIISKNFCNCMRRCFATMVFQYDGYFGSKVI